MSALAVVAGLGLGLGLALVAYQSRLALALYLAHIEKLHKPPAPAPTVDAALVARLDALEAEVARSKVERLTGRR